MKCLAGVTSLRAGGQVFTEEYLVHFAEIIRKDRRSEFSEESSRYFRGLLDLAEEQGRYGEVFSKGSKLRRGRTIDPSHKGRWIYTWISISGIRRWKSRKHCNGNRDIPIRDILKAKWICVGHSEVSKVDRWHTILGFRGEKSRNNCIRIRDIAKSEMPMR
jgi:hypothetical protein